MKPNSRVGQVFGAVATATALWADTLVRPL